MKSRDNIILCALIVLIGVCHIIMSGTMPLVCDDLKYGAYYKYYDGSILYYPRWVLRHYVYNNGRYPNLIAPLLLYYLPGWVVRVLTGGMMMVWLYVMLRLISFRRYVLVGGLTVIAAVVFTFTWWDSFTLHMVVLNYIWAIATVLTFVMAVLSRRRVPAWLLMPLAAVAGLSHEAASMPMACGLAAYLYLSGMWRTLSRPRRVALIIFAVAAAAVTVSPGTVMRFGKVHLPDDTPAGLILRSTPYCVLLVVLTALSYKRVPALAKTRWTIYAVAAVMSAVCVLLGGIVGRSGWFAQTYALMAIAMMLGAYDVRLPRWVTPVYSVLIIAAIAAHYIIWMDWHRRLSREATEVIGMYYDSADGVVHYDCTRRGDVPWYVLRKARGVPDADDYYAIGSLCYAIGDSARVLTVLPMDELQYPGHGDMRLHGGRDMVTSALPPAASDTVPGGFGRRTLLIDDIRYIVVPYRRDTLQLYYITPKDYDPADSRVGDSTPKP